MTFTGEGVGTLTAMQAGNSTYGAAPPVSQNISIIESLDLSSYEIEKSVNYVQSGATNVVLQAEGPYQFSANVQGDSGPQLLSRSTVAPPTGSTGSIFFQADSVNGLNFDQDFITKSAMDSTFASGTAANPYAFTIQTSTPSTYIKLPTFLGPDGYPTVIPQLTTVTNATWTNGYLEIIDPTQPTTFNWNVFNSASGNINFNINNLNVGQGFTANGTNTSFTVPANTFSSNTAYVGELDFSNSPTIPGAFPGIFGGADFANRVQFGIQVGTVPSGTSRYTVSKSHVLVQTANTAPVNSSGDRGGYDASPYEFHLDSPVAGTDTGPNSKTYPLVYNPYGGDNDTGNFEFSSGAVASQATLDSTYANGNYTMVNGTTVALTGSVYPNVPQVMSVNGGTPVWNALGQLVLDPTVANTITWTAFNEAASTFATNGHVDAQIESNNSNNLDIELQSGATETNLAPINSLTIPANAMTVNDTYVGRIQYFLASALTNPNPGVYDVAGYATTTNFTAVAQPSPIYPLSLTSSGEDFSSNSSFNVTGETLQLTLNFAPYPGEVLTILNNTGSGPIVGNFNNLPDGGTITLVYNGTPYIFTANYEGGDGNDLTLTYTPPISHSSLAVLHSFLDGSLAGDGSVPVASLARGSDGNFYGTTQTGGSANYGTIFRVTTQGIVSILHSFGDGTVANDGNGPDAPLVQGTDGNFYGTTVEGGSAGLGTVFKITSGGGVTILHSFGDGSVANDGNNPECGLIQSSDGNFYGTAEQGGLDSFGVVFKITPAGVVSILHSFGTIANDGEYPEAAVVQASDGNYYGTTEAGGSAGFGAVFKLTSAGTVTIQHSFGDGTVTNDGKNPVAALIQSTDGNFYGTASDGGFQNNGTLFKITPQGTETILHVFGDGSVLNDGSDPEAALILGADGNYYGTTEQGGAVGSGSIFKMTPQGVMTILHSFGDGSVPSDGTYAIGGLIQDTTGIFYGTTSEGGGAGEGTIYKLAVAVPNVTSALTASGTVSLPFRYQTTAANTPTSYTAINLPAGLTINNVTGLITGTPVIAGTFNVTLTLTNASGSTTVTLTITIVPLPPPVVTSILYAYGSTTAAFNYQTTATNNPTSYSATGLPDGLEIDPSTGAITGTPTTVGTYPVSVSASNASGTGNSVNLSISIFGSPPTLIQEYDVLHNFGDGSAPNDAQQPSTLFQGFDGNFYGASTLGGAGGLGAIFETNVQGTTSVLNSATSGGQGQDVIQGSDGNFYGTNLSGGANLKGFIYQLTPQGALRVVHTFGDGSVPNDGANPNAGMIQGSDGNFYGTTSSGGSAGEGTVFQLTPQGVLTILHSFGDNSVAQDGLNPENGLIQATGVNSSIIFYGTTQNGGSAGTGTVYTITSQGVVTILHSFGSVTNDGLPGTSNGLPRLVQGTDGNFYGVTAAGGSAGLGCAYQITPAGQFTVLHSFGTMTPDGANPVASLIEGLDGNFYGTTQNGGSASDGTVFQLIVGGTASSPTGTVNLIHQFGSSAGDGAQPIGSLFQGGDGNFYGTTATGGSAGDGTVFVIVATQTPAPTLVPVFAGASSATSSLLTPFSFTPKASFGFTGTGAQGNIKKAISKFDAGTAATYWELSGTLPQLLTFNSATGTIIGTPIQAGIFTIYLTAVINNVSSSPQAVTLDFDEPPVLNCPTTASGTAGSTFTYQITAAAGNPSNFGMTGLPFPGWLSVDTTSGLISGTPPASGTFTFSPTASNNSGTSTQQVTLRVTAVPGAPTITSASAASGTAGTPFTYQITAQNSPTSFTALTLPPGLTFNSATGLISGTPTTFGTFSVPIGATNNVSSSAAILTITIAPLQTPVITGNLSVLTAPGSPFSYQVSATGVVSSYAASNLPSGLTINSLTGLISGTPTVSGTFDATIAAENLTGESLATLDLLVANTSATVSLGNLAATYNGSPISATATTSPPGLNVTFTYNSSATPPTAAGSYTVVATINDPFYQGTTTSTLVIAPAPITVALKGGTSTYGQNISSLVPGISVTGLAKNDVVSSLGYTSVITGTGAGITTTTDAGSYKLTIVGALTNSNYMLKTGSASPVGGSSSWTVTQATLTVNALSGTSVYGQMPTTPSQLYTLVSSDGVTNQSALLSLLSGAPATSSYTFNITNATAGGKYATDKITSATLATGLNPRDYKVALGAAGAWTVTQDIITITGLTTGSSTYGSAPVFNSSSYFTVTDTDNNPDAASLVTNVKATLTATATSNAGTYSVAVSGALNTTAGVSATDYKIVLVPGSWKVNPQPVAISIAGGTSVYGAAPAVPALTGTGTVNGRSTPLTSALLKGFSTNLLTVVGAKGNSGVGTYAFNLTGAPTGNYTYSGTETAVTASWKITPATISAITVNKSASAVYGSYLIDKALTVTGLVNGDLPHLLGYTLTGLASNLGVGTYTFGVGGSLTDSNYTLKAGVISPPVAATGSKVTITAAPLTFTLLNGSSTYGTTPTPAQFNYSVTGLVNGDTVESTDILLGFTETPPITATTARGTIALKPVAPKVLSDPNYTASKLVGGTWTVH
jgi:uncharacterized repeat protein (TIGR03803 family)